MLCERICLFSVFHWFLVFSLSVKAVEWKNVHAQTLLVLPEALQQVTRCGFFQRQFGIRNVTVLRLYSNCLGIVSCNVICVAAFRIMTQEGNIVFFVALNLKRLHKLYLALLVCFSSDFSQLRRNLCVFWSGHSKDMCFRPIVVVLWSAEENH